MRRRETGRLGSGEGWHELAEAQGRHAVAVLRKLSGGVPGHTAVNERRARDRVCGRGLLEEACGQMCTARLAAGCQLFHPSPKACSCCAPATHTPCRLLRSHPKVPARLVPHLKHLLPAMALMRRRHFAVHLPPPFCCSPAGSFTGEALLARRSVRIATTTDRWAEDALERPLAAAAQVHRHTSACVVAELDGVPFPLRTRVCAGQGVAPEAGRRRCQVCCTRPPHPAQPPGAQQQETSPGRHVSNVCMCVHTALLHSCTQVCGCPLDRELASKRAKLLLEKKLKANPHLLNQEEDQQEAKEYERHPIKGRWSKK